MTLWVTMVTYGMGIIKQFIFSENSMILAAQLAFILIRLVPT